MCSLSSFPCIFSPLRFFDSDFFEVSEGSRKMLLYVVPRLLRKRLPVCREVVVPSTRVSYMDDKLCEGKCKHHIEIFPCLYGCPACLRASRESSLGEAWMLAGGSPMRLLSLRSRSTTSACTPPTISSSRRALRGEVLLSSRTARSRVPSALRLV